MKKILLVALILFGGWNYFKNRALPTDTGNYVAAKSIQPAMATPSESFNCDGRQHCSQMNSRPEAEFFVRSCPNTKMDGDHDGIPCENDSRF